MKFWRLNWALKEILTPVNYAKHKEVLQSPWRYWTTLSLKFFPKLWKKPVLFRLREGGAFYVKEFMSLYIYREVFVDKYYDYPKLSVTDPVILDVGANTGFFAIRMKQLYPSSTVYCFEPFSSNFKQLSSNIEMSNFKGVHVLPFGVGGFSRKERLYIHKSNIGGHSIFQAEANNSQYVEIQLFSLKEIFKSQNINRCNFLKMDCEGAEGEIIKSLDSELASSIEKIIFEPTPTAYNLEEMKDHLRSLGFSIEDQRGLCVAINSNFQ
jgi:FkbM family methyltransferase